jgi:diguanylate cyclase (GGDEF)-like protein
MDDDTRAGGEVIVLSDDEKSRCTLDAIQGIALLSAGIEKSMANNKRRPKSAAIVVLSIDNLASIRYLFGIEAIEPLLIEITRRLRDCLRTSDVIGRLSDDQLGILLPYFRSDGAMVTVERALALGSKPAATPHGPIDLKLSADSVSFPDEDLTPSDVITRVRATLAYVRSRKDKPLHLTQSICQLRK